MKKKILRLAIIGILVVALLELFLWTVLPVGAERPRSLRLENELPGFSKSSRVNFDTDAVRSYGYQGADRRILFLGGDNTLALLQDTPDTWWVQARKKMSGPDIGVAAWGVPNGGSVFGYRFLSGNIEALEPDLVVLTVSPGEVVRWKNNSSDPEELMNQPITFTATGWKGKVIGVSQIARRLRNLLRGGDAGYLVQLDGKNKYAEMMQKEHNLYRSAVLSTQIYGTGSPSDVVADVIARMDALCKEHDAKLMVVGEPFPQEIAMTESEQAWFSTIQVVDSRDGKAVAVRIDPGVLKAAYEEFFEDISKACDEMAVPFVPTHEELNPSAELFTGDRLLNDLGHQVMADTVAEEIEANLP